MNEPGAKLRVNPIVKAALKKADKGIHRLSGFIGDGRPGKVDLYLGLDLQVCLELDYEDVIHVVYGEKETEPSTVFVREGTRTVVRRGFTISSEAITNGKSCSCTGEVPSTAGLVAARVNTGGTGNPDLDCFLKQVACKIKCWVKHPNDPLMEQACNDSCDAAYRLCSGKLGGFGGGIVIL